MKYYLLDVKRTVKINGIDVAFDYINTFFYPNEAIKEAKILSINEEVLDVSVHEWSINENGEHEHSEDGMLFHYKKR